LGTPDVVWGTGATADSSRSELPGHARSKYCRLREGLERQEQAATPAQGPDHQDIPGNPTSPLVPGDMSDTGESEACFRLAVVTMRVTPPLAE
jgi:hypothetical protein